MKYTEFRLYEDILMTKSEKRKLAEIILDMQHGGGDTFETNSYAATLINTFPSVKEFIWELEGGVYVEKVSNKLYSFLFKTINPVLVSTGKYKPAYDLSHQCKDYIKPLVSEYCLEKEVEAETLYDDFDHFHNDVVIDEITSLLRDEVWCNLVDEFTNDSLERRFLKGELEEYSFIEEIQGE